MLFFTKWEHANKQTFAFTTWVGIILMLGERLLTFLLLQHLHSDTLSEISSMSTKSTTLGISFLISGLTLEFIRAAFTVWYDTYEIPPRTTVGGISASQSRAENGKTRTLERRSYTHESFHLTVTVPFVSLPVTRVTYNIHNNRVPKYI